MFDLWGTLAYTDPHLGKFIQKINTFLNEDQIKIYKKLRGAWYGKEISSDEFFSNLINEAKLDESYKDKFIEIWESQLDYKNLYPESIEILNELRSKKIKLALISNATPIAEKAVKTLELEKFFDVILYSFREGLAKPNKKIFEIALERLKLNQQEVIMVGDQLETDEAGAKASGIKFILIDRNNELNYADKVNNLSQILPLLD